MSIWKVTFYTLAAIIFGNLGHRACATLSNTATSALRNLKPLAEPPVGPAFVVSATPLQTDSTTESQYLLETKARQLSSSLVGELGKSKRIQQQEKTKAQETLSLPSKTSQVAQETMILSDVQSNWAHSFIELLIARGIIRGFPDRTFRPDEPVTRVQFASMLQKAFQKAPVRNGAQFVDIPTNYWGNSAIQAAYKMGFLEGYPDNIFNPDQNIPRVQALIALVSGLDISVSTTNSMVSNIYFRDASQIPHYACKQVATALQNRLIVNYPNLHILNPNQVATRAEVAAFIYEALVKNGTLPELTTAETATHYIASYKSPQNVAQQTPKLENLRQQFHISLIPLEELRVVSTSGIVSVPGSSVASPTAFGADLGNVFVGASYQARTRFTNTNDGGVVFGFGLGERQTLGLEVAVSSFSTLREGFFTNGGISLKLHHLFPNSLAIAAGVENAAKFGSPDAGSSVYGVVSKVFNLKNDVTKPFSTVTISLGLGGGRFRSEHDIQKGIDSVNVFGSVGLRVAQPISLIADWTGQDLTIGTSITPLQNIPVVITPAIADVTGKAGDGARFILGVGFGYSF